MISDSIENLEEIIVVDGGSIDGSQQIVTTIAKKYSVAIQLIPSKKGRAKQLNAGAAMAKGTILYFLHADSLPPKKYDRYIIEKVNNGNLAGCFRMKFDSNHWWLRFLGWMTKFNNKICRGGDQSQFITTTLFKQINGYDESYIVYEDNEFVDRLYAIQQFIVIPKHVVTSARRYKEIGVWRLQYYFLNIHIRRWLGASSEDLHQYYKKKII